MSVGFCSWLIMFAITKVLPLPVIPSKVCFSFVEKLSISFFTAVSWPGDVLKGETNLNCIALFLIQVGLMGENP